MIYLYSFKNYALALDITTARSKKKAKRSTPGHGTVVIIFALYFIQNMIIIDSTFAEQKLA